MPAASYLQPLVAPLRFLAQSDFARLLNVKGLDRLVRAALAGARAAGSGTDVQLLERLSRALESGSPESQQDALRALAPRVRDPGPPSAPSGPATVQVAPGAASSGPPARHGGRPSGAPRTSSSAPPEPAASVQARSGGPVAAPGTPASVAPPGKRTKRRASPAVPDEAPSPGRPTRRPVRSRPGKPEAEEVARPIAAPPSRGPLAQPIGGTGIRVPPRLVEALNKKGLHRVGDLLFLLPRTYEDRRRLSTLRELRPGERGVAVGTVRMARELMIRPGKRGFQAVLADETGSIALTWFQSGPWMKSRVPVGKRLIVSGELRATPGGREMVHPEIEPADEGRGPSLHMGRVVPVYPGFERHEQRQVRELVARVAAAHLGAVEDPLSADLRQRLALPGLAEALARIHQPAADDDLGALEQHRSPAHRRLAFDELFLLHLGLALRRQAVKHEPGIAFHVDGERLARARELLPFSLTRAQARAVAEIGRDMARPEPMHRLLQGDVGSGKTAVAAVAAALAVEDGWQVALMAPTEILAAQHHTTLARVFGPAAIEVALVTGSGTGSERRRAREAVESGRARIAVGTQALIQEGIAFQRLGLVLIDEQHRFGVLQRQALGHKGRRPDVLVMTATPIPRTLAMTLYGDLDLSVLDELPPGRTPVTTRVATPSRQPEVWEAVELELRKGRQAYVLYPLVEASEKIDLADATRGADELQARWPHRRVQLLHGRLKQEEKDAVMDAFRSGQVEVLVCTTVVEVGVDVANASVMVIQNAERFGLSQLHQLRGRVGRGAAASFCYLLPSPAGGPDARTRLEVLEQSTDGFVIAEKDLELRGPGEFLGTRQSGLPELSVANLARDQALSAVAAEEAKAIAAADPRLTRPEHRGLLGSLEERWEGKLSLARVG
ncbi:MAG TPA: ATP-dependent DNA helicase RecG [Myxococcaceae bacterium]|nr:ATP-dependent DNA helicase RecG [Myxococcaceae bacterium]